MDYMELLLQGLHRYVGEHKLNGGSTPLVVVLPDFFKPVLEKMVSEHLMALCVSDRKLYQESPSEVLSILGVQFHFTSEKDHLSKDEVLRQCALFLQRESKKLGVDE